MQNSRAHRLIYAKKKKGCGEKEENVLRSIIWVRKRHPPLYDRAQVQGGRERFRAKINGGKETCARLNQRTCVPAVYFRLRLFLAILGMRQVLDGECAAVILGGNDNSDIWPANKRPEYNTTGRALVVSRILHIDKSA